MHFLLAQVHDVQLRLVFVIILIITFYSNLFIVQ